MKKSSLPTMPVIPWNQRILEKHPKSEPDFWPNELKLKYMALEIEDLRSVVKENVQATQEKKSCILCHGHGFHVIGCPNETGVLARS